MEVKLYAMAISHPSLAARKMLDLKGIDYELENVVPLNQRFHLRLAGFRGGTVPALKLDGQRVQGSREIARAVDQLWPEPPLFPRDPALRERVEEAERWGEERLQPVPRRLARYGAANYPQLRRQLARQQGLPTVAATLSVPLIRWYARSNELDGREASEQGIRADLESLPGLLAHAEELLADGTLSTDPPNAATLQILATIRVLGELGDVREFIDASPCGAAAKEIFPRYPASMPTFLPSDWLAPLKASR